MHVVDDPELLAGGTRTESPWISIATPRRENVCRIERRCSTAASSIRTSPPVTAARPMNEATSMWSAPTRWAQPPSDSTPWMVSTFEPMPSIRAPMAVRSRHRSCTCGSQAAFAIVVLPARQHRRHDGVLGAGHGRLVEVQVGAAQPCRGAQAVAAVGLHVGAQAGERHQVGIDAAPADDVAARRRDVGGAEAGEQRAREQDRGADARAQLGIERGLRDVGSPHPQPVRPEPLGLGADVAQKLDHRLDVADAGHVVERDGVGREQAGRQDREGGVLVAGRA